MKQSVKFGSVGSFLLFAVFLSSELRGEPYGFAGCGVGTKIFGARNWQTSASTTNHGTIGIPLAESFALPLPTSQPWSISMGWAGCDENAMPLAYFEQYNYMFANFSALAKELAQGGGATVDGLASTFGCGSSHYEAFASHVRSNYESIFSQPGIRAVFLQMREELEGNQLLVAACSDISTAKHENIELVGNQNSEKRGSL
jgi:hypothetical protein